MGTTVDRLLPTEEAEGACSAWPVRSPPRRLAPQVAAAEERAEFPAEAYRLLGRSGLLSLPFEERYGGGGQPYEVYLQVIEEIATAWPSVGVGTSVHALTATVVAANASDAVREEWLPKMLSGDWLGAYCLSEPQAGSDVSGIRTAAVREGEEYVVKGTKQWISNGSCADYYILFARTSEDPKRGLSAFVVPDGVEGMSFGAPEKKMGLHCDVTTQVLFDGARIPAAQADRRGGRRHAGRALRARRRPARDRRRRHGHRPGRAGLRGAVRQGA
ncbi:acyl-CoA dehydrogenase family protein [Nocardioides convexus]|uniref:acyl-CoA dehydrogenase family protein n=1 Tax=Nocardioides convexus TaxID=2712224 RepID=UPI002418147C|nr:acyl-CoA dehydrogenase family protein [Nocardioides convexus]